MTSKAQIRNQMRYLNNKLPLTGREIAATKVFRSIEQSHIFESSTCIALYASLPDELPTRNIIDKWHSEGKRIVLPRVEDDETMNFHTYAPQSLSHGAFGIEEPSGGEAIEAHEIELMILPGLAFSLDGHRLGRGRGYYDRYLSRHEFRAYTIGVCLPHQLLESIPYEEHDKVLNHVVSDL